MKRAMVIDDQECLRVLVRTVMEGWNPDLKVEEAMDGYQALANLEVHDYDFLVCDVRMPGIDGFELVRRIRQLHPTRKMPILMLTAEDQPDKIAGAMGLGATAYLTKPFNADDLLQALHGLAELVPAR